MGLAKFTMVAAVVAALMLAHATAEDFPEL